MDNQHPVSPAAAASVAAAAAQGMANAAQGFFAAARAKAASMAGHVPPPTTPPQSAPPFTPPGMRSLGNASDRTSPTNNGAQPPEAPVVDPDAALPWRPRPMRYASNEVYVDIVEELDAELDAEGKCVRSSVVGEVFVTSRLSGAAPELSVRISDTRKIDDTSVRFHPCVHVGRWNSDRCLSLVPPDGTAKVMAYAARDPAGPSSRAARGSAPTSAVGGWNLPLYVKPVLSWDGESGVGKMSVMVGERRGLGSAANGPNAAMAARSCERVVVRVPFPTGCDRVEFHANVGTVVCDMALGVAVWNVGKVPRDKAPCLNGTYTHAQGASAAPRPQPPLSCGCIAASFALAGETASGIVVDSMAVSEPYNVLKRFKATVKGGRFHVRLR